MSLNVEQTSFIYSMYRASEVSVHQAWCERASQSYFFGGGGTISPGSRPAGGYNVPHVIREYVD